MLSEREHSQIGAALVGMASVYVNYEMYVPLKTLMNLLRTFSEAGVWVETEKKDGWIFESAKDSVEGQPVSEPRTVREGK